MSTAVMPVAPLLLLMMVATFSRVSCAVSDAESAMSIETPLITSVAVASAPITVVVVASMVCDAARAVTPVCAELSLMAAAIAIALAALVLDPAVVSEKVSSEALDARIETPFNTRSPVFKVRTSAPVAEEATARASLVMVDTPRS